MTGAVIVLAAGAGRRLGGVAKALLPRPDGRTFLEGIVAAAHLAAAGPVFVVLGPPHQEAVERALPSGARSVTNPHPERGMLSSVQVGVAALPASTTHTLVWPVDTPAVQPATIAHLLATPPGRIIVPRHRGRGGHPVLLPRSVFPHLLALDAAAYTLRELLAMHADLIERVEVSDAGVLTDVDVPADLRKI